MNKKRVVITGMGAITPLGLNVKQTWEMIIAGKSGISELTRVDKNLFPAKVAAEINNFDPSNWIEKKEARRMDRFAQFALTASIEAMNDANLKIGQNIHPERLGVWIGSGVGGLQTIEDNMSSFLEKGYKRISPFAIPMLITNMATGQVAIYFGAKGITSCSVTACASGTHSIGDAFRAIQRGEADAIISGGAEAPITNIGIGAFSVMNALSFNSDPTTASRPFDKNRDGFVMGEGAGILILEEYEHAIKRGSKIYAELTGFGSNCDAFHITSPDPEAKSQSKAIELALNDANLAPTEIDYINAHGTSTPYNDRFETLAIKKALGKHAYQINISSTKSSTGHLIGAAGGLESIFSVLSIVEQKVPPTINLKEFDEEMDLNYTPNKSVKKNINVAISNSFGFGGHNGVLVFSKCS